MLKGSIVYKKNDRLFRYDVDAMDTSETFSMYMTSGNYDALLMMCNPDGVDDENCLDERAVEVKLTKVNVETKRASQKIDGREKFVKCDVNADLFCRLGALIRFVKTHCDTRTEDGYTGLRLASGEFEARIDKSYTVPYPDDSSKILATVTLRYSDIIKLRISTPDFEVALEPAGEDERIFYHPKDAWSSGIKLNEEYLGFPVIEAVSQVEAPADGIYTTIEEIMAAHPEKELAWLLDKDYRIVDDEHLEEVCDYIRNHEGYVYYDTETTGLNITFLSRTGQADQCVGVILSVKYGESFFFPLQMKRIKNLCGGDHFYVMEHYLRPILEGKELVTHNGEFDWKVGYIYGINCNIVHDTMAILELTLAEEIKDYKVGLKDNAKLLLGRDSLELSDLIVDDSWGENDIKFWDLPYDAVRLYACADTDNTYGLLGYAMQNNLLGKYGANKVYQIEVAFSLAVAYQEFYGHRIDINNLDIIREEIGKGQDTEMKAMEQICGHEFNPNSPKQLVNILYNELGIPEQVSRKTGRLSTDKETLKKLGELTDAEDNAMYPFVSHLLKYREYEGVRKVIDKFPEYVTSDGFIFSKVMQYGTTTGRVSINSPNYQSYNDPIKKNVVPRPGYWMFDTDYSSVEYRVLGNMVGNKKIMESFKDPDFDYHTYQAARMYGVPYSAVTKKLRKAAKGINFGLPYGMGDESLGTRIFGEATPENTRKAAALRAAYFKGQEDIRDWFEFHRNKGVNLGYTETYFGRRRYYRKSDFSVSSIRRQAGNMVIQGCLSGDTKVETKEFGIKPIRDLVGYSGLVWNGTDWTHGDVLYSGKKQKCVITFTNGQKFICSPIHRFQIMFDTFRSYQEINPNWEYDVKNEGSIGGMFVRCRDLKTGQAICINENSELHIDDYNNRMHNLECIGYSDDEINEEYKYTENLPCVIVESVEITDEYIDMYDVCNTDCGYYVADGIITHNTAADIYKTAVGRVFKRICREGWLGKVLFDGFIHDELLGEVSNDINPAVWLKVLREEFEVKVTNDDGSPWSPLYMGFGYGMSWYEAKSVELPIRLQWEIVEKYGDTGFPQWDGDGRKFCDGIPDMLRDFEIRDSHNQLIDPDSQGKEIKPALNTKIMDLVKDDSKLYAKGVAAYAKTKGVDEVTPEFIEAERVPLTEFLNTNYNIQGIYVDENGTPVVTFEQSKDTQRVIDQFCMLHSVDRSTINVLSPEEYSGDGKVAEASYVVGEYDDDDEDEATSADKLQKIKDTRIDTLGMYVDTEKMEVTLLALPPQGMMYIKQRVNYEGKGYRITFKDSRGFLNKGELGKLYITNSWLESAQINNIQELYLQFFKTN